MVNVTTMQLATAVSVPKWKMPSKIPATLSTDENKPHTNRLRVSPAAWKMDPEDERIICIPTESVRIRKTGTDGSHWLPKIINVISYAVKNRSTLIGKPMKARNLMMRS